MVIQMPEPRPRPVPVVRLIVPDASGRVLILRRAAGTTGGGSWCLPGGKIEYGDTVEAAAIRELQEETGLRATSLRFLFYQDSLPAAPGRMHCIHFYWKCATEGEVALNGESDASAWIAPPDLDRFSLAFRNDEALALYWRDGEPKEK